MTPAAPDLSILALVAQATIPVQLVMLVLIGISLASWTVIFKKLSLLRRAQKDADHFENEFWDSRDLNALYENVRRRGGAEGLSQVFAAGMGEYLRGRQQGIADNDLLVSNAQRAMRATGQREHDLLERGLPFLATAGSVSPYIGLFGTVWGIMHAFTGLANIQQATLASVAPGIAEALIATAIGLFAAIPAVVGYNRFATQIDRLSIQTDVFCEEFVNLLARRG